MSASLFLSLKEHLCLFVSAPLRSLFLLLQVWVNWEKKLFPDLNFTAERAELVVKSYFNLRASGCVKKKI